MKTCDTCKHWTTDDDDMHTPSEITRPTDPDTWEPMVMPFEVRRCQCDRLLFHERPVEENGACVVDGSGYFAGLCTGPKFGCTFHEE